MKAIVALFLVMVIIGSVLALGVFPSAQARLERAAADRALARAELRRADADVARAQGEADALRMSASTPVVVVALMVASPLALGMVLVVAIVMLRAGQAPPPAPPRERVVYLIRHPDGTIEQLPAGAPMLLPMRLPETEHVYRMDGW